MSDNITLPREVVEQLLKMLEMVEPYADQFTDYSSTAAEWPLNLLPEKVGIAITALRKALAAVPTKQEPGLVEGLTELARQMKPLDADMAAILNANIDSLYIEDEPALAAEQPKVSVTLNPDAMRTVSSGDAVLAASSVAVTVSSALAAEPAKREFDHSIGADRFKVVRGIFWWHVKIGDSPTEHGKFRSSEAAQKMADDLLREFRNGAFVQNALAAEQPKHDLMKWAKDAGSSPEDLERFATYTIATRDMEIATLREENEALRRDAERYRWLRGEHSRIDPCIKANAKYRLERDSSTWVNIHDLDAAIDAAMKEGT